MSHSAAASLFVLKERRDFSSTFIKHTNNAVRVLLVKLALSFNCKRKAASASSAFNGSSKIMKRKKRRRI